VKLGLIVFKKQNLK